MNRRSTLFALALSLSAPTLLAQNKVQNPNFNTGPQLANWAAHATAAPDPVGAGTDAWDATHDFNNDTANSGSGHVAFSGTGPSALQNAGYGLKQCVDLATVQPVNNAAFGVSFLVPAGQPLSNGELLGSIEVTFYGSAGCTGTLITGGMQGKYLTAPDLSDTVWLTSVVSAGTFAINPLPSPLSAEVRLVVRRGAPGSDPFDVYFDNAFLAVNGTTPVLLQRFVAD